MRSPVNPEVCIVGLGYVGLPLAVAFADAGVEVVGFDVDEAKVARMAAGSSPVEDIADVLADAEAIVDDAIPDVVAEIDRQRTPWWRRLRRRPRGDDDGDDFRLSNR